MLFRSPNILFRALVLLKLNSILSVGDAAKNAFHSNPENTVFDAKRLIGRKFEDPEVKRDQKHWPFKIVARGDKPVIQVKHKGDIREFVCLLFPYSHFGAKYFY